MALQQQSRYAMQQQSSSAAYTVYRVPGTGKNTPAFRDSIYREIFLSISLYNKESVVTTEYL